LTDVLSGTTPDLTEQEVAARIGAGMLTRGIEPVVLLGAGRSRLHHRHPLPGPVPIGDRAMFVLCGRRNGMISNATRWVRFGPARPEEADAMARIAEVEADFFDATTPGTTIGAAWSAGVRGYERHGFAADEWRNHHQGGAAGYFGRDPLGLPDVTDVIQVHQPFAWNPSGPGAKIEDTVLTTATGIEVLTTDPRWPTAEVGGRRRPIELEL
jgi:Xaa-Pro aminopeptidase